MLARAHTFTIDGLQARHVTVEVDIRPGLPAFTIVGLADAAVREARERVRAAILNSGLEFPPGGSRPTSRRATYPRSGRAWIWPSPARVLAASGQLSGALLETMRCSASWRSTAA